MRSRLPLDVADLSRSVAAIARARPGASVNALLCRADEDLAAEAARAGVAVAETSAAETERPTCGEPAAALEALGAVCATRVAGRSQDSVG